MQTYEYWRNSSEQVHRQFTTFVCKQPKCHPLIRRCWAPTPNLCVFRKNFFYHRLFSTCTKCHIGAPWRRARFRRAEVSTPRTRTMTRVTTRWKRTLDQAKPQTRDPSSVSLARLFDRFERFLFHCCTASLSLCLSVSLSPRTKTDCVCF